MSIVNITPHDKEVLIAKIKRIADEAITAIGNGNEMCITRTEATNAASCAFASNALTQRVSITISFDK